MGKVRDREFDAVIGVGGLSREPVRHGIARRLTWIGITPHQVDIASDTYPVVAFEHFYLKDQQGPFLSDKAPKLAARLFAKNAPRVVMLDADDEIVALLRLAKRSRPSPAMFERSTKRNDWKRGKKNSC